MTDPIQINMVEKNMHRRGLNTWHSRPIKGAREDMAMRYEEVNQLAVSNASRSAAMEDWVVVRIEMFVAMTGIRRSYEQVLRKFDTTWFRLDCRGAQSSLQMDGTVHNQSEKYTLMRLEKIGRHTLQKNQKTDRADYK